MFYVVFYSKKMKDFYLKYMIENKIHCQTHYEPLHSSKMGRFINKKLNLKNVENYSNKILRFPLHLRISIKDIKYINLNMIYFLIVIINKSNDFQYTQNF